MTLTVYPFLVFAYNNSLLCKVFDSVVRGNPAAIVLEVFDSGQVPDAFLPAVQKVKEKIPVFGLQQSIIQDHTLDLTVGRVVLDSRYDFVQSHLKAGIVPLQGIPSYILEASDLLQAMLKQHPELRGIEANLITPADRMFPFLLNGLQKICEEQTTYAARVLAARTAYNSPGFNGRLDKAYAQLG